MSGVQKHIVAIAALENVYATPTIERVVSGATQKGIPAAPAEKRVDAIGTNQRIIPVAAFDLIRSSSTDQRIVTDPALDHVVALVAVHVHPRRAAAGDNYVVPLAGINAHVSDIRRVKRLKHAIAHDVH